MRDKLLNSAKCKICNSDVTVKYKNVCDTVSQKKFVISECNHCSTKQTTPFPENISEYYHSDYHGGRHGFTGMFRAKRRLSLVNSLLNKYGKVSLLDIGCGDGTFLLYAKKKGWDVTGTELNPEMAIDSGIEVKKTLEEIPQIKKFDCITMWHSFEHMENPLKLMSMVSKRLNPGGVLIVAVPDSGGAQSKLFKQNWFHLDVPRHLYHFNRNSLSYILQSFGFTTVRQWHQELEYDIMGWVQSTLNLFMSDKNALFNLLTKRKVNINLFLKYVNIILGGVFTLLSLPAIVAGSYFCKGGTLIIAAKLRNKN